MGRVKKHMPFGIRIIIGLLTAGIAAFVCVLCFVCIRELSVPKDWKAAEGHDAIIVLGAQVYSDGKPSVQLSWRLEAAGNAYEEHPVPIVVCGAQGPDEPMPEAEAMRNYLVQRGIPEDAILMDGESFNTRQNLENAKKLLADYPAERVLIVSSDYHVPRAMALAGDLGLRASGLGSPCKPEYWIKNHVRETLAWLKYWGQKYLHLPL